MDELVKRLRERAEAFDYDGWVETASDYEKAADAIEELRKPRWIPVTERLPEKYVNVLVFLHSLDWNSIYYGIDHLMEDGQWWKASTSWKHKVTHWMPLPEPPDHIGEANEMVEPPKDGES